MRASTTSSLLVLAVLAASFLSLAIPLQAQPNVTPMSHPRIVGSADAQSLNWAGYAVTGPAGSVTSAQGSWLVPAVTCSSSSSYAAFWVGIDGYSSDTVEQTGTMAECVGGSAYYYAWYEFYPNPSYEIGSVPVSPGDKIAAGVTYSDGQFTVTITDTTSSKFYSTSATVSSAQESSAEWIAEAPSSGSSILPLANFGTAFYGQDYTGIASTEYATVSGSTGPISSFGSSIQEITMVSSSGSTQAQPSAITSDGTSFSVAWGSSTTTTSTSSTTTTSTSTSSSSSSSSTTTSSTSTTGTAPALTVSVSTSRGSYTPGSMVVITVAVTSAGSPVSRASVTVTVTTPNGGTASGRGNTGYGGAVSFVYQLSRNSPTGTYTVSASASAYGYGPGTGSTTFSVS